VDKPIMLMDIMPTILETLGLEVPDTVDGSSMLGLMTGEDTTWRDYVHGEHSVCYDESNEMHFLTDGRYKYVWLPRIGEGMEQLFDLSKDPGELKDLSAEPEFYNELLKWRKRMVKELKPRGQGLTKGEDLVGQAGRPYVKSPAIKARKEKCGFDWDTYKQPVTGDIKWD